MVARNSYKKGVTDKAYPDTSELRHDIGEIVKGEMKALVAEER